jgi:endonuclease/exonuclease/phosphatase family metal-dependent hydrolase
VRPDALRLSLWSRVDGEMSRLSLGQDQHLPRIRLPGIGEVIGIHNQSISAKAREKVSQGIARHARAGTDKALGTIVVGDFNETLKSDKGTAKLRTADYITRWVPRFIDIDYFHGSPLEIRIGTIVRGCAMARGTAIRTLANEGFQNADPDGRPTVFSGSRALRVDHIVATPDIRLQGFQVIPRTLYDA